MIPAGDHSSRNLVHRRVSSWSQVTQQPEEFSLASEELLQPLLPELEYEEVEDDLISILSNVSKLNWRLWVAFILLVVSGVSNVVLAKLQSLPMYNYPTFLNMYANAMYIFISFCYILPAAKYGWFKNSIPWSHLTTMSKKPFLVMGFLDAIAGGMQVLASIYLPGKLLVLLPQAGIPLSMLASRVVLREKFSPYQYVGAGVVFLGIIVVLFPVVTHQHSADFSCQAIHEYEDCALCQTETTEGDCLKHNRSVDIFDTTYQDMNYCKWVSKDESLPKDDWLVFVWSLVMVASCVPMVLSSVYKQVALQVKVNPILVNGWVAVFQFICGIPLVIPAGMASSPSVKPLELPHNWANATQCLFTSNNSIETGCHPDHCSRAALWVHLGLLSSVSYTISMIFLLKYGSASLLYLGLTLMVPLGHLIFSIRSPSGIQLADVVGLMVLVLGLILYRFGHEDESVEPGNLTADPEAGPSPTSGDGNVNTVASEDKNGFLEFLREPFMLVGDI